MSMTQQLVETIVKEIKNNNFCIKDKDSVKNNILKDIDDFTFKTKDNKEYRAIASDRIDAIMQNEIVWNLDYIGKQDANKLASCLEVNINTILNIQKIKEFAFLGEMIIKCYKLKELCNYIGYANYFSPFKKSVKINIPNKNWDYYIFRIK